MLRIIASYFTSNIKPNTTNEENLQENVFNFTPKNIDFFTTETEDVEHPEDISSLRERKLRELTEKVLLRKIYRQMVMNRHAQDHLPLSQIQEKLEEEDLPLKVLQDKLRQKENSSIYTTIRENINFLLYSKSSKQKKSKNSPSTPIITETDNTSDDNNVFTPKDDRDYDIWDDAVIGHLMNLVDTIGVDITQDENSWIDFSEENPAENFAGTVNPVKETSPKVDNELIKKVVNEVLNEVMKEEGFKNRSSRLDDIGSTKVTLEKEDKETIVAGSSAVTIGKNVVKNNAVKDNVVKNNVVKNNVVKNNAVKKNVVKKNAVKNIEKNAVKDIEKNAVKNIEKNAVKNIEKNNTVKNIENNTSTNIASTNIENNVTTNIIMNTENDLKDVKNDIMDDVQENIQEDTNIESRKIAEEIINFGETINVAESLLRSDNLTDNEGFNSIKSFRRKSRRSLFSLSQSSTSSNNKNPNQTNQTHRSLRRNVSNLSRKSSIHSKKSYENDISRRSSISSKFSFNTTNDVIIEEQNEDGSNNKFSKRNRKSLQFLKNIWKNNQNSPLVNNEESFMSSREIREKYYQQFDDDQVYPKTIGAAGGRSADPDYSNFYLSMPNGKWMVRTRTGSRKITGTQYVDKEFI